IALVERLEDDHLVAWIRRRKQRRGHAFRSAAASRNFKLRVQFQAVASGVLPRDGSAKRLCAPGDGILIVIRFNSFNRRPFEIDRRGEIRESLRQVDGAMLDCQARHLADYRLREPRGSFAVKALARGCRSHLHIMFSRCKEGDSLATGEGPDERGFRKKYSVRRCRPEPDEKLRSVGVHSWVTNRFTSSLRRDGFM